MALNVFPAAVPACCSRQSKLVLCLSICTTFQSPLPPVLLRWRAETAETGFEKTPAGSMEIAEQEYFDNAVLMVAMVKAGVELAFESMEGRGW